MATTAAASRMFFAFLLLNAVVVLTVAALRPLLAGQSTDAPISPVQVEVPPGGTDAAASAADAPAVAEGSSLPSPPSLSSSSTGAASTNGADTAMNRMVMDEMLKVIEQSRGELDVPHMQFPALSPMSSTSTGTKLDQLAVRIKSIAAVAQTAQTLIKEAQLLRASGQTKEADQLIEQVQLLKSIIVQLSAED